MNHQAILAGKTNKTQYSEAEAARELGVSVEQLRSLIRSHVAESDEDINNVPATSFHPSDLLLLKLFLASNGGPNPQGSEA
jgi:hypothetical protein